MRETHRNRVVRGFSLVEILVVLAIAGILAAIGFAAFSGIGKGNNLNMAEQMMQGHLNLARQTALTQNRPVEVRLYSLPEDGGGASYRAIGMMLLEDDGTPRPVERVKTFPSQVIASNDPSFTNWPAGTASSQANEVPGQGTLDYLVLQFRPNGATSTAPTGDEPGWTITLLNPRDPAAAGGLPANYVTLQISPQTGIVRSFRP
jgi:uncharacterized protein (TIGR02596 family)